MEEEYEQEQYVEIPLQEYKTLLLAYAELMTIKRYEQMFYKQEVLPEKQVKQKIGFKTN